MIESRKQCYQNSGVRYNRGLAFLLADGIPEAWHPRGSSGDVSDRDLALVGARVAELDRNRSIAFFTAYGYGSLERLRMLAPHHRPPVRRDSMEQVAKSIEWLFRSVSAVSQSRPGDSIRLPQQDFLDL